MNPSSEAQERLVVGKRLRLQRCEPAHPFEAPPFNHMMGHARAIRRDGSAALDLAYVAAGRADRFWEERLCPWDMAVGILLVEEAGGRATRFDGSPLSGVVHDEIVATNGPLHPAILKVIAAALAAG